jgi:hypothetical protein
MELVGSNPRDALRRPTAFKGRAQAFSACSTRLSLRSLVSAIDLAIESGMTPCL